MRQIGINTAGVCYVRGGSREVVPALAAAMPEVGYEYIPLDGSHKEENAQTDLINTIPLIAPGGIIIFDDAGPTEDGAGNNLIAVWDEVVTSYDRALDGKHYDVPCGFCVGRPSAA